MDSAYTISIRWLAFCPLVLIIFQMIYQLAIQDMCVFLQMCLKLQPASCLKSEPKVASDIVADIIVVSTSLLDLLPKLRTSAEMFDADDMIMDDDVTNGLDADLQSQLLALFDPNSRLLEYLVNAMVKGTLSTDYSDPVGPSDVEMKAVGSSCAFVHVTVNTFHLDGIMTTLAYRNKNVPALWHFIKCMACRCSWLASASVHILPRIQAHVKDL